MLGACYSCTAGGKAAAGAGAADMELAVKISRSAPALPSFARLSVQAVNLVQTGISLYYQQS